MAGPWEKYADANTQEGPWNKYREVMPKPASKAEPKGEQVYAEPTGPEQATLLARAKERIKDPARWQAILNNTGPYANKNLVQGDAPLVMPGGAIPRIAKAATALSEGTGLGYAAGRTALAGTVGAVQSGLDTKPGESWQNKIDRTKGGAALSAGVQAAAESVPFVGKALGYAARKVGSALSGIDENIIANYARRTDQVNDLIKKSGGDVTEAADQVRTELSNGVQGAKRALNNQISGALASSKPDANIAVKPIIAKLEAAKSGLNPNFKASAISDIDDIIKSIEAESVNGMVNPKSLYQIKQFLNEGSASAYNKGGQIFTRASEAARAAKDAAAETRNLIKVHAPEISKADAQLARLHAIERRLNRNMLAPGKPDASLLAAGAGTNPRNAANLKALEEISGVPASQRARDLATARVFANPSLMPTDFTGKSAARILAAGGIGTAAAGPLGGAIGAALTSPMAIKTAVNAVDVGREVASKLPSAGKFVRQNPVAAQMGIQLGAKRIRDANQTDLEPQIKEQMLGGGKGPDRWAANGLERLGIKDQKLASQLLRSKKGRQLLIEASDLPPGSRRLNNILEQINKGDFNDTRASSETEVFRSKRKPASRR